MEYGFEKLPVTDGQGDNHAEQFNEMFGGPTSFFQDGAQRTAGDFFVIRNDNGYGSKVVCRDDRHPSHCLDGNFECGNQRRLRWNADFFGAGMFEVKLNGLVKIFTRLFDCLALAGYTKFWARGYVPFSLMLDDGGKRVSHIGSIPYLNLRRNGGNNSNWDFGGKAGGFLTYF